MKILEVLADKGNHSYFDSCDTENRVDVLAKNRKGDIMLIDIHNFRILHYSESLFFQWTDSIFEHINLGNSYKEAIMIQNDVLGNAKAEGRAEGRAEGAY